MSTPTMPRPKAGFWQRIDQLVTTIPNESNRALLKQYLKEKQATGLTTSTLRRHATILRGLLAQLGERGAATLTREDVMHYVTSPSEAPTTNAGAARLHQGRFPSTQTLAARRWTVRSFARWLRGSQADPIEIRGLKAARPRRDFIPTDELLTRSDLLAMIRAAPTRREKAILAVLHESGLRAGEFCALNVRSLQFDEHGAILTLPKNSRPEATTRLKTGARRVRLFDSVPYLRSWFQQHPFKANPEASLWLASSRGRAGTGFSQSALRRLTKRAGARAKLRKNTRPLLFRHSAATERARAGWSEPAMRAFFGWSHKSDMPSHYVHLTLRDYEEMELERRGLTSRPHKTALAPTLCPECGARNAPTNTTCSACRKSLNPQARRSRKRGTKLVGKAVRRAVRRLLNHHGKKASHRHDA